jgi:hypothetical protein
MLIDPPRRYRRLETLAGRAVVMHGHRHIACGSLKIISAPSPVMNATDAHTLAAGPDGRPGLLPPQRVEIADENNAWAYTHRL